MEIKGIFCFKWALIWFTIFVCSVTGRRTEYPLGAIFDRHSENLKFAFKKQIDFFDNLQDDVKLTASVQELDSTDSFAVSNAICALLSQGVYGIIGVSNAFALSTIQSYSNTFNVPFLALSVAQDSSTHGEYQLYIRPMYINALLDVIVEYGWRQILYIYDTDEGLLRLQQLFQAVNVREHPLDIDVKRVHDVQSCYELLKTLQHEDKNTDFRVFLDIPTEKAEVVILTLKNDSDVANHKFHFLLGELRMGELTRKHFEKGGINITGFQLLNYTKLTKPNAKENSSFREWMNWEWPTPIINETLPLESALVLDAVNLFHRAIKQQHPRFRYGSNYNSYPSKRCTDNSNVYQQNGSGLMALLKGSEVVFEGLTGKIDFDQSGYREHFQLYLFEITITMRMAMVGLWTREDGLRTQEPQTIGKDPHTNDKHKRVTTILEMPYVMYKPEYQGLPNQPRCGNHLFQGFCVDLAKAIARDVGITYEICLVADATYGTQQDNGTWTGMIGELVNQEEPYVMYKDHAKETKPECGKDNFHGFCVDLTKKIAEHLKFDYDICLVKDGLYGTKLDNQSWNGMIGELTRDETDMVIAPMTITSQRERVVDFTKPYMSLGISIIIRKTKPNKTNVFSFMDPLSYEIWMCILFAYIGVSVVLFLVSRFSPTEWHVEEGSNIKNDFTISNSLWYSLGAFMQQGCDISPRSVSGRIVGSVWWFFTLIIISSYTANLAAFLTVERMLTPIESAEDLAKQTEIQYGILESGSTKDFFKYSKFPVHERMWAYMQSATPSVFVKTNKEGIARVRSQGNYAYLMESTTNDYTNMRSPCDTMKVGPNLDSKGYGIATPIGSPLRDQLTLAVLKLRESGELESLRKEWWERRSECGDVNQSPQEGGQAELTLEHVAGIFYILIAGLVLSVIIACLEFLYKSKVDSTNSKKSFGSVLRCKARLSFRGSLDRDTPAVNTPLRKSMSTYTYTGPSQVGNDGFPDNLHTQV